MTQAQRETGGFLPEKDWESECGMDDIQDALDEGSEKAWVGCFQGHRCIKVWLFILSRWVDGGEGPGIHWCGVEGGACQPVGGGGACSQVAEGEVPLS